jgi:hypothetical protein
MEGYIYYFGFVIFNNNEIDNKNRRLWDQNQEI